MKSAGITLMQRGCSWTWLLAIKGKQSDKALHLQIRLLFFKFSFALVCWRDRWGRVQMNPCSRSSRSLRLPESDWAHDFLLSTLISKKRNAESEGKIRLTQNESRRKAAVRTTAKSLLIVASAKEECWGGQKQIEKRGSLQSLAVLFKLHFSWGRASLASLPALRGCAAALPEFFFVCVYVCVFSPALIRRWALHSAPKRSQRHSLQPLLSTGAGQPHTHTHTHARRARLKTHSLEPFGPAILRSDVSPQTPTFEPPSQAKWKALPVCWLKWSGLCAALAKSLTTDHQTWSIRSAAPVSLMKTFTWNFKAPDL